MELVSQTWAQAERWLSSKQPHQVKLKNNKKIPFKERFDVNLKDKRMINDPSNDPNYSPTIYNDFSPKLSSKSPLREVVFEKMKPEIVTQ